MKSFSPVFKVFSNLILIHSLHLLSVESHNELIHVRTNGFTEYTILTYLGVNIEAHRDYANHLRKVHSVFIEKKPNVIAQMNDQTISYGKETEMIFIILIGSGAKRFEILFRKHNFSRIDWIKESHFSFIELKSLKETKLGLGDIPFYKNRVYDMHVFIKSSSAYIVGIHGKLFLKKNTKFRINLSNLTDYEGWEMYYPNHNSINSGHNKFYEKIKINRFYVDFNFRVQTPIRTQLFRAMDNFSFEWLDQKTLNMYSGNYSCKDLVTFECCQAFNISISVKVKVPFCKYTFNIIKALPKIFPCRLFMRIRWGNQLYSIKTMVPFDYEGEYAFERLHMGVFPKYYYYYDQIDEDYENNNYFSLHCHILLIYLFIFIQLTIV